MFAFSVLNISNFKLVTSQIPAILSSLEIDDGEVFGYQKSRQVHRHGTQFNVIFKPFWHRGAQKLGSFSGISRVSAVKFTKDLYAIMPMAGDLSGFSTPPSSISSELKIAGQN